MRKFLWACQLSLLLIVISGCGHKIDNQLNLEVDDFTFTNQNNEQFGLADLKGSVWIAEFVFTNCKTVCIPMMSNMAELQETVNDQKLDIEFVSFTVDPDFDQPEVLKKYGEDFHINFSNWNLLSGYTQLDLEKFAMKNFKTYAKKTALDDQVIHGTSFFLVDKNGVVIKEYSGLDIPIDEFIKDLKYLLAQK